MVRGFAGAVNGTGPSTRLAKSNPYGVDTSGSTSPIVERTSNPTVDGRVMNFEAALQHHFRHMPVTDVELQVPAHAQQDEIGRKVTSLEPVRHPSFCSNLLFATEPFHLFPTLLHITQVINDQAFEVRQLLAKNGLVSSHV